MNITFYETLGKPEVDGECTTLREGLAELAVAPDTLMNLGADQSRCQIDGVEYLLSGPAQGAVWSGVVNPNTRRQRRVQFAQLRRIDGQRSPTRIVLIKGKLARGEAILNVTASQNSVTLDHDGLVCFTQGCNILTAFGDLPIQNLRVGDLVHTADNGLQPIRWIGEREVTQTRINLAPHLRPVVIRRDTFGPGLPISDMRISQKHRMVLETDEILQVYGTSGILAPAAILVNDGNIQLDPAAKDTRYIHLLFDDHQIIFADGIPTESFYPCPSSLMSLTPEDRRLVFSLMPHLESHPLSYGPCARPVLPVDLSQFKAA